MCEYCVKHGAGKKWYLNAMNYSKNLARSEFVREFCGSYFTREIQPSSLKKRSHSEADSSTPFETIRSRVDQYYQNYLYHQVLTPNEAIKVLQLASKKSDENERSVVLLPCVCRYSAFGSDSKLHCYGIAFTEEYTRRFPTYLGGKHQYLSADSALHKLQIMQEKETVVHSISALGVPYLGLLCNCDMKVCIPFNHREKYGIKSPFYRAHYRGHVDISKCSGCGTCETVCPFNVPHIDLNTNFAVIDPQKCYGCGICIKNCPEEAINHVQIDKGMYY